MVDHIDDLIVHGIRADIDRLLASDDALIGSDEGTHGTPGSHRIYETVTGERYATYSFAGSNSTRCSVESAYEDTEGYIRLFPRATQAIRDAQAQLKRLREELRQAQS